MGTWGLAPCTRADVLVVLSDETASYQQVADELRVGLNAVRDGRVRIDVVTAQRVASGDERGVKGYELVITVGLAASRTVVTRDDALSAPPPTLCLLIPRQAFDALSAPRSDGRDRRISAVFLDQPLSRQLDLVRFGLPGRNRVGVVLGPSSAASRNDLRNAARERGLTLNANEIAESSGVYGALQQVLPQSDVFLALPDPVVFNSSTVYGLLLTTYRTQVPVVGFSEGLVKAGALLGLFSTARQVGKQGAEIAGRFLSGETTLPAPQYPRYFTVRVNETVARSLGIPIEDSARLTERLVSGADGRRDAGRAGPGVDSAAPGRAP